MTSLARRARMLLLGGNDAASPPAESASELHLAPLARRHRRRWCFAPLVAVLLAIAVVFVAARASARPVRIGRYVEIPFGVSARHPWRTGAGDRQRSARSPQRAPETAPSKRWETRIGVGRVFAPAIAEDGTLFVGSQSGVTAVSPQGTVRWALRLGLVSGTPSLTPEGNVAVGAQPGELMILGGARSRVRARVGGGVRGSPLVLDDGSVVVAAYDQAVHRFDALGRRVFRTSVPTHVRGPAALTPEGELVVPVGRELLWFSAQGRLLHSASLGAETAVGPAVAPDGTVWVVTTDGTLLAMSSSGRALVRTSLGVRPSLGSGLAIAADGSLRLGSQDGGILCVGPSGTLRWQYQQGSFSGEVIVDAAGQTLAVSQAGRMVLLGAQGEARWTVEVGRTDAAPVLGSDGVIYVTLFGGVLQAWH